jgi:hypothetical protein
MYVVDSASSLLSQLSFTKSSCALAQSLNNSRNIIWFPSLEDIEHNYTTVPLSSERKRAGVSPANVRRSRSTAADKRAQPSFGALVKQTREHTRICVNQTDCVTDTVSQGLCFFTFSDCIAAAGWTQETGRGQ